jgi:hypothetical protein
MEHQVVRGARILQQLDEASTAPKLRQNITTAFPDTTKRQNATSEVAISNMVYIPYIGTKMLHIKAVASSNSHQYQVSMQFTNVVFDGADTEENVTFTASDNTEAHIQPIDLANNNVKVRCTCLDFYHRFANYNSQDKSLVGRAPPVYVRKTTTRPPVNPTRVPGMCKHLLKLVDDLRNTGMVK